VTSWTESCATSYSLLYFDSLLASWERHTFIRRAASDTWYFLTSMRTYKFGNEKCDNGCMMFEGNLQTSFLACCCCKTVHLDLTWTNHCGHKTCLLTYTQTGRAHTSSSFIVVSATTGAATSKRCCSPWSSTASLDRSLDHMPVWSKIVMDLLISLGITNVIEMMHNYLLKSGHLNPYQSYSMRYLRICWHPAS
jgi:hypothetical protein